MTLHLKDV